MIATLVTRIRRVFVRNLSTPEPPDEDAIKAKYREHDRKIAELRQGAQRLQRINAAVKSGLTGNVLADMQRGTYRPSPPAKDGK